jgi:hypothetical protein
MTNNKSMISEADYPGTVDDSISLSDGSSRMASRCRSLMICVSCVHGVTCELSRRVWYQYMYMSTMMMMCSVATSFN